MLEELVPLRAHKEDGTGRIPRCDIEDLHAGNSLLRQLFKVLSYPLKSDASIAPVPPGLRLGYLRRVKEARKEPISSFACGLESEN
jgi:hypothetical protein